MIKKVKYYQEGYHPTVHRSKKDIQDEIIISIDSNNNEEIVIRFETQDGVFMCFPMEPVPFKIYLKNNSLKSYSRKIYGPWEWEIFSPDFVGTEEGKGNEPI